MERRKKIQDAVDKKLLANSNEQEELLDKELATSLDMQLALEDTALAIEAIDAAEDAVLKNRLQHLEQKMQHETTITGQYNDVINNKKDRRVRSVQRSIFRRKHIAIAAAILLLIVLSSYYFSFGDTRDTSDLYAANFQVFENVAVNLTRSNAPSPEELAFTAYENQDYSRAVELMRQLGEQPTHNFYMAQAYLALNEYDAAIEKLRLLIVDTSFPLQKEANWYMALALLGKEDVGGAKSCLSMISQDAEHPYAKQAAQLLQDLNK